MPRPQRIFQHYFTKGPVAFADWRSEDDGATWYPPSSPNAEEAPVLFRYNALYPSKSMLYCYNGPDNWFHVGTVIGPPSELHVATLTFLLTGEVLKP